jgi:hypothetical protein
MNEHVHIATSYTPPLFDANISENSFTSECWGTFSIVNFEVADLYAHITEKISNTKGQDIKQHETYEPQYVTPLISMKSGWPRLSNFAYASISSTFQSLTRVSQ